MPEEPITRDEDFENLRHGIRSLADDQAHPMPFVGVIATMGTLVLKLFLGLSIIWIKIDFRYSKERKAKLLEEFKILYKEC